MKFQCNIRGVCFIVSAFCVGFVSTAVSASNYTFTNIADTTQFTRVGASNIVVGGLGASINNSGTVVFYARYPSGDDGILIRDGETGSFVIDNDNGPFNFDLTSHTPVINDAGIVAFAAGVSGGSGVFTIAGFGEPVTTVASTTAQPDSFNGLSINSSGVVSFTAGGGSGVYKGNGGSLTAISTGSPGSHYDHTDINDSGVVVYKVINGQGLISMFKSDDSLIGVDNTTWGGLVNADSSASINANGTVVFQGEDEYDIPAILTTNSGFPPTIIAESGSFPGRIQGEPPVGPLHWYYVAPAINAGGMVAFLGNIDAEGYGIFTGPDAVANKVIKTGDSLFGSTITHLGFSHHGLNDNGDVAFSYRLANGVSGVAVAKLVCFLGDTDGDWDVDFDDFLNVQDYLGDPGPNSPGDADCDGDCDFDDFLAVQNFYGQ